MADVARDEGSSRSALIAALVPILCLLPFAGKAFHIDDTFYLWVAEQILNSPGDFYGFDISWGLVEGPAYEMNKNPPGSSYYLALFGILFGWGEIPIHLSTILLSSLLSLGIFFIARRFTSHPLLATMTAVLTPAYLVSSNTAMSDIPMFTGYVWACLLWLRGLERKNHYWLAAAGVLMGTATLTKYFGMTTVPLLFVYTVMYHRKATLHLLHFLIPIAMIAAYQAYAYRLYGISLISDAAGFAVDLGWNQKRAPAWTKPVVGLSFMGGCFVSAFFFIPVLWKRRVIPIAALTTVLVAVGILLLTRAENPPGRVPDGLPAYYLLQYALLIVAGLHIAALAVSDLWRHRDRDALFLFLWLAGTFLFSTMVNWTINARTMLPMAPVVGMYVARRWELRPHTEGIRVAQVLPLACALAITLCVLWSDYRHANSARTAAHKFITDSQAYDSPYYYKGHWGFQYYMDRGGIQSFKPQDMEIVDGARVVVAVNNAIFGTFNPAVARAPIELKYELPASRWISTHRRKAGTGFYTHSSGPVPFVFGPAPLEEYGVFEIRDYEGRAARGESVPIEYYELPED